MFRVKSAIICVIGGIFLSSCSSMKTQDKEETQKIKTAKVNIQLGIAYLDRNNVSRAKKKLLVALDQAPNIPETWYSMAYFLESTGNKEQAKKYYLKSLAIAPQRGDVQNNYGTFLCRSGQYQQAIEHFMLAVKDPDYLDYSDAYENAGLCSLKIPDKNQAYRYFTTALIQNPSKPVSLIKMAQIDYDRGDYDKSKIELEQFLALAPENDVTQTLSANLRHKVSHTTYASDNVENEIDSIPTETPKRVTYKKYLKATPKKHLSKHEVGVHKRITANKKIHAAVKSKGHGHSSTKKTVTANVKKHKSAPHTVVASTKHKAVDQTSHRKEKAYSWSV